ncbi:MAG: hypothetical protein HOW73_35330 [Polyangiaceae bacterium]|nr:hypothetical protein [Polyangiaceae bacterium]
MGSENLRLLGSSSFRRAVLLTEAAPKCEFELHEQLFGLGIHVLVHVRPVVIRVLVELLFAPVNSDGEGSCFTKEGAREPVNIVRKRLGQVKSMSAIVKRAYRLVTGFAALALCVASIPV